MFLWLSVPPQYAEMGSITTSRQCGICSTAASSARISRSRENVLVDGFLASESNHSTASNSATLEGSAPAASSRGRMVSAGSSSALMKMVEPTGLCSEVSGQGDPLETRAAMSSVSRLFPLPGSPAISVNLPMATHRATTR